MKINLTSFEPEKILFLTIELMKKNGYCYTD